MRRELGRLVLHIVYKFPMRRKKIFYGLKRMIHQPPFNQFKTTIDLAQSDAALHSVREKVFPSLSLIWIRFLGVSLIMLKNITFHSFLSKVFPSYSLPLILLIWCWAGRTSARAMSLLTSGGGKGHSLAPHPGKHESGCLSAFPGASVDRIECRKRCLWHFFPSQWKHWFYRILLGAKFYFQLLAYIQSLLKA